MQRVWVVESRRGRRVFDDAPSLLGALDAPGARMGQSVAWILSTRVLYGSEGSGVRPQRLREGSGVGPR
jgi:hypothetical protein